MSPHHRRRFALAAAAAGIALAVGVPAPARADDGEERMTLPKGRGFLQGFLEINLSKDLAGKPVSLAPDVWYGVSNELTVGLLTSGHGQGGFFGGAGNGLCFVGKDNGCAEVLTNIGLAGRYHLSSGSVALAAEGGLTASSFDPFTLSAHVGLLGRWQSDKISVLFAGTLFLGLNQRDAGNKESLAVPVTLMYAASPRIGVGLQSGVILPFEHTADTYLIPLSFGVRYLSASSLSIDAVFSFPAIAGGPDGTGADARVLTLAAGYAF